jgi:catechol 2,3-dioxygenase-like lactoylglutathione lyase family enzyme
MPRPGEAYVPLVAISVARPTADLDRIRSFYAEVVGLPLLWSFADHDGFDGAIFGLPDERAQLELVRSPHGDIPAPTNEDALVLYHGRGDYGARPAIRARHGIPAAHRRERHIGADRDGTPSQI